MFVQGNRCFFCEQPLPRTEASVEHLVALANGGTSRDDNCVACCKVINTLLGSMSLKEKLRVVLNQKGKFKCPDENATITPSSPSKPLEARAAPCKNGTYELVLGNLKGRGSSRPRTIETLTSTIGSLFKPELPDPEIALVVEQLLSSGKILLMENKVAYAF